MFRRRNEYDNMMGINREAYHDMREHIKDSQTIEHLTLKLSESNVRYFELLGDIRKLERENALFRKMFDDADSTSVIKYNGKLFKITKTSHFTSEYDADILSIDAVLACPEGE